MHDLTYLQDGTYRCKNCGETTDRAGHAAFQETDCSALANIAAINKKIAAIGKRVDKLEAAEVVGQ